MIEEGKAQLRERLAGLPEANKNKIVKFVFEEIPNTPFLHPDGRPNKEWIMLYRDTVGAASDATRGAVLGAALNAACTARGAGRDVAWGAAWDAAWNAALSAAREAALDVAHDAALMAGYLVVADLGFKDKVEYLEHALARWEVWQKGYWLLGDIDGKLYVYSSKALEEQEQRIRLIEALRS